MAFPQVLMSSVFLIDVDQIDKKSKMTKSVLVPVDLLAWGRLGRHWERPEHVGGIDGGRSAEIP